LAPDAWHVVCELDGGEDRLTDSSNNIINNFNLNFNTGANTPWAPPSADLIGWHKEGWVFHHFLDRHEQSLLVLLIWRDIEPLSGGTFYVPDSVPLVAQLLLDHPEGLHHSGPWRGVPRRCSDFREVTASAGDMIILHPFLLHTKSQNPSGKLGS
jgi:hypothetical protein